MTLIAFGSRGDVMPLLALAAQLRSDGHTVHVATHPEFSTDAAISGLEFTAIGGSYQEFLATRDGRRALGIPGNSPIGALGLYQPFRTCAREVFARCWDATAAADLIVSSGVAAPLVSLIAPRRRVPVALALVVPAVQTRNFSHPAMPPWPLGRLYKRWSYPLAARLIAHGAAGIFREWRQEAERLGGRRSAIDAGMLVLVPVSRVLLPRPSDWPDFVRLAGFWFPTAGGAPVPDKLAAFMAAGAPPIVLGFGSMVDDDPGQLRAIVAETLHRLQVRAVVVGGSGNALVELEDGASVCTVPLADYDWLFARSSAVIHQGGVGTAAYALRAGVPQVTVPYCLDHAFWTSRLQAAGVAPAAACRTRLTASGLTARIARVLETARYREAAAHAAQQIRQEEGVAAAAALLSRHFPPCG